ncbi:hypothetical protein [Spiroplasma apis]|nr:hypothetical protein [Spiroplasma apis]
MRLNYKTIDVISLFKNLFVIEDCNERKTKLDEIKVKNYDERKEVYKFF